MMAKGWRPFSWTSGKHLTMCGMMVCYTAWPPWHHTQVFTMASELPLEQISLRQRKQLHLKGYPHFRRCTPRFNLGPVLFLAFMNDLPDACCSPTEIYADDTLLHLIIPKNDHTCTALTTLQASVTNATCWANSWRDRFSPSKTVMLPIGKTASNAGVPGKCCHHGE